MKLYYEHIEATATCKNGSQRYGATATTNVSSSEDGTTLKAEVLQFGRSKVDAKNKLLEFLGKDAECVGKFKTEEK